MSLLLDVCLGKTISQTPIWIMRQAGRYLPEYRAIRKNYNFQTMLSTPDLIEEVTLQPINRFDLDAAIIFSDILVVPHAMGHTFKLIESVGPVFDDPVNTTEIIQQLPEINLSELNPLFTALRSTRNSLDSSKALVGFAGSPWTIATYLVEGKPSKDFRITRKLMYSEPNSFHLLMDKLTEGIIEYLQEQIKSGVDVIQIFDTNAGFLSRNAFENYSLPYLKKIIQSVNETETPCILFVKGGAIWIDLLLESGAQVLSLDWIVPLGEIRPKVGEHISLQGNLDPVVLLADQQTIRNETINVLESYGIGHRHIFNLGHGITPDVPIESVQTMIDTVREESSRFHKTPEPKSAEVTI